MPKVCEGCSCGRKKEAAALRVFDAAERQAHRGRSFPRSVAKMARIFFRTHGTILLDEPGMKLCSLCKVSLESLRE
jgi:hypothetical protein